LRIDQLARKSYTYKVLNRAVGKALHQYGMISDGDRIAVGVSGGMDSLTLFSVLQERKLRVPVGYELAPIYIDPGFKGGFGKDLQRYFQELGLTLRVEYTDYGVLGHSQVNRENPCFLCARLRRKRLFEIAEELGCKKLALGHNKDDIIETLFLNIFYSGEISTMVPDQSFFKGKFRVIRPLAYVDKQTIERYAGEKKLPRFDNPCPTAKVSKRQEVKTILNDLYAGNKKIKGNIFRAMRHVNPEYLLK